VEESTGFDEVRMQQGRLEKPRRGFSSELGLSVAVRLVEQRSLEPAKKVVDRRQGRG
jgi:hypothetical protein